MKAHPRPLHTYTPAVAKQASLRYTRKGYAYEGVSQSREVVATFSWRLFECKPHQNFEYSIFCPSMSCTAAFTPYGDQFSLPCICSDGLRHHHNNAAKIRNNIEIIHIKAHFTHYLIKASPYHTHTTSGWHH